MSGNGRVFEALSDDIQCAWCLRIATRNASLTENKIYTCLNQTTSNMSATEENIKMTEAKVEEVNDHDDEPNPKPKEKEKESPPMFFAVRSGRTSCVTCDVSELINLTAGMRACEYGVFKDLPAADKFLADYAALYKCEPSVPDDTVVAAVFTTKKQVRGSGSHEVAVSSAACFNRPYTVLEQNLDSLEAQLGIVDQIMQTPPSDGAEKLPRNIIIAVLPPNAAGPHLGDVFERMMPHIDKDESATVAYKSDGGEAEWRMSRNLFGIIYACAKRNAKSDTPVVIKSDVQAGCTALYYMRAAIAKAYALLTTDVDKK